MIKKWDKVWLGLICGIIMPVIMVLSYYQSSYSAITLSNFVERMVLNNLESKLISVAIVGNLGVFFLFIWLNADRASKGVVGSMFLYGVVILYFKFIK
ncbi:MAG: hypothetical protein IH948_06790 [Bacteroidetes bacterium]|nr:hypothetical protein [Bacteroidota bacterium]